MYNLTVLDFGGLVTPGRTYTNETFMEAFGYPLNTRYRNFWGGFGDPKTYNIVQHGPLSLAGDDVWAKLLSKRGEPYVAGLFNDPVHLFGANGPLESVSFRDYVLRYEPNSPAAKFYRSFFGY